MLELHPGRVLYYPLILLVCFLPLSFINPKHASYRAAVVYILCTRGYALLIGLMYGIRSYFFSMNDVV